ncbi:MAG: hypothetical protein DMF21_05500 [Verrucomicrobia bacterium]|nr:MAG: hypothetical protein DMF21_05500 [Verrucomicrobiota bacterium]
MPNENSQAESAEKKKREIEVRDLKPKTDPKGGATDEKQLFEIPTLLARLRNKPLRFEPSFHSRK